jgi:CheY-like chemotaxis protein
VRVLPPTDVSLAGFSALVVDDNATHRSVLSAYLSEWGMTVATASDGEAALATMRGAAVDGRPFAVVLVDRSMPGMDGLAVKKAIVADRGLAAGVVLMTDLGGECDTGDTTQPAMCASLSKPIRREDLRSCLREALGLDVANVAPAQDSAQNSAENSTQNPAQNGAGDVAPPVGGKRGHLLLAEDNLINQKVAVAILTTAGYSVDTVLNGAEAVCAVAAQPYDAILMDCQMPELSGYEATAAIRVQGGDRGRTPIIAMTAGARREDQERCLAEGMDSYLSKPVSKDALLALVDRSVRTERR